MIKVLTKVEGLIVKTTNYGETSLIIELYTKEYGTIGIMGKGVKSMKSRLRALTQNFTYGFFYIYYKENKLSILKDVDIINPLTHIHEDITLISYLNYIVELTTQVYKESLSNEVFPIMIDAILKINDGLNPGTITHIIEVKYLEYLGVGLHLNSCVNCGETKSIVTVDPDQGGLLCKECYRGERLYPIRIIQLLRMYSLVEIKSITKLDIKNDLESEIETFLQSYYHRYTGMYLQSKEFLKKIANL